MKKRFFLILSAVMLTAGCDSEDCSSHQPEIKMEPEEEPKREADGTDEEDPIQEQAELPDAYKDILDQIYAFITADSDRIEEDSMIGLGLAEAYHNGGTAEGRLSSIGYSLYDVDHNGIQELIIVEREAEEDRILYLYTLDGDAPVLLAEGWSRSIVFLLEDDVIYQKGYDDAMYTSFSTWHIAEDGKSLAVDAYYFTDYLNGPGDMDSLTWFFNTTGEYDMEVSEAAGVEDVEDGFRLMEEYEAGKKRLDVVFYCDHADLHSVSFRSLPAACPRPSRRYRYQACTF